MSKRIEELERRIKELEEKIQLNDSYKNEIKNRGKKEKIDMSLVSPAGVIMIKDGSDKQKIFNGKKYGE